MRSGYVIGSGIFTVTVLSLAETPSIGSLASQTFLYWDGKIKRSSTLTVKILCSFLPSLG